MPAARPTPAPQHDLRHRPLVPRARLACARDCVVISHPPALKEHQSLGAPGLASASALASSEATAAAVTPLTSADAAPAAVSASSISASPSRPDGGSASLSAPPSASASAARPNADGLRAEGSSVTFQHYKAPGCIVRCPCRRSHLPAPHVLRAFQCPDGRPSITVLPLHFCSLCTHQCPHT